LHDLPPANGEHAAEDVVSEKTVARKTSRNLVMAKGQKKSNKEARKPKQEKAKPPIPVRTSSS
jgi:hypothetical protein